MELDPLGLSLDPDPVIEAYKPGLDRTLLLRNLQLTPEQRIEQLQEMAKLLEELRRAGQAIRKRA